MAQIEKQIERLAETMDLHAESDNDHNFVGVHRALAVIAYDAIGPEATLKLFKAIKSELGIADESRWKDKRIGLHAVAYLETDGEDRVIRMRGRSVPRPWRDWSLSEKSMHRRK